MKTMTCRQLGGPCDQQLTASTWDEMVQAMTRHVLDRHPETAKEMKRMHEEDPKRWGREMKPKSDARPDSTWADRSSDARVPMRPLSAQTGDWPGFQCRPVAFLTAGSIVIFTEALRYRGFAPLPMIIVS